MTKEEALKQFAYMGAVWFGNSKQHFAFSAYDRFNGWNKLADKWKEEAEEEWDEAEAIANILLKADFFSSSVFARSNLTISQKYSCS